MEFSQLVAPNIIQQHHWPPLASLSLACARLSLTTKWWKVIAGSAEPMQK